MKLPSESADWYVIRARPGSEHLAVRELREGGYEVYLPMRRVRDRASRLRKMRVARDVHQPVLAGYLFLASPRGSTVDWGRFRDDPQFRHVGRPLVNAAGIAHRIPAKRVIEISVNETNGVYDEMGAHGKLAERFIKGKMFAVTEGSLASARGLVDGVTSGGLIRLLVNIFGGDTVVTVDPSQLDEVA